MDNLVLRYLTKIGIKQDELDQYSDLILEVLGMNKMTNIFKGRFILIKPLSYKAFQTLFNAQKEFENNGGFKSDIAITYPKGLTSDLVNFIVEDYINNTNSYVLDNFNIKENMVCIGFSEEDEELTEAISRLNKYLEKVCPGFMAISYQVVDSEEDDINEVEESEEEFFEYQNEEDDDIDRIYKLEAKKSYLKEQEEIKKYNARKAASNRFEQFFIKDIDAFDKGYITGKVFLKEIDSFKKFAVLKLYIYDKTSSMECFFMVNKEKDPEKLDELDGMFSVGQNLRVKGRKEVFHGHTSFKIIGIPKILEPDKEIVDEAPEKRVELHLHTKFSEMDGVNSIDDYAKFAKSLGHKAVAITDHGCVQGFPSAQKASEQHDIKMLYGAELYCVDEHLINIFNPSKQKLREASYVVFDLETTGLSARYDRIIEFGAVKIEHANIEDEVDFFVKPDISIPTVVTKLTGIDDSMVAGGKGIKRALEDIVEFFGDSIIVAHNATFDVGFINEALKVNGMKPLTNPVIDTLPLSRYLFPKQRRHSLGAISRLMEVDYDEESAHRAVYDAKVLGEVFQGMLSSFYDQNIDMTHEELSSLQNDDVIYTAHPFHVTVLVKNSEGLKDLYKLVSESNIKYFSSNPLVPRSVLNKYRKNLLVGSSCFNGEIFEAGLTRSKEDLQELMKFYDYIELQPLSCYSFLINDGQVASIDNIKKTCKDIIDSAKEINKIVVATGDVHYLREEQKEFRDVYIDTKGKKGVPHPLNPYRRAKMPKYDNPDQMFLTTTEMKKEFSYLNDEELIDEIVVKNTNLIADMIEVCKPLKDKLYTPTIKDCDKLLEGMVFENAKKKYGDPIPQVIMDRLEAELKGIRENNYYVIYYIASLLVTKTNAAGYIVGSRGSVGSSLIATMSNITEVNPLAPHYICKKCKHLEWADPSIYRSGYDLPKKKCPVCGEELDRDGQNIPFATFLGFKAEKVPDIDLNFPKDFQSQAHEMTKELLGADNVFKAGTIETVAEKTAISFASGYYERKGYDITKIPFAEIKRLAYGCIDVKRTTGQHPGGIIVIPEGMSVYDFTPIQYPADSLDASWKTTHFDFHAIHDNVLKLDMLGHVDPYALKMMLDMTGVDIKTIPYDDPKVLSLFTSNSALNLKYKLDPEYQNLEVSLGTLGIPEFGTDFARRLLSKTKPTKFADLLIISGLSHGTNVFEGNAEVLISSKTCTLQEVIGCRDDIMNILHDKYKMDYLDTFQIMEMVRKGMFNLPSQAAKREKYETMMREHDVPEYFIDSCKKIKYLFPRAHATAYCMMGVRVGWFKVHYPLEYYATYFTLRCDQFDIETMMGGIKKICEKMKSITAQQQISVIEKSLYQTLAIDLEMERRGIKLAKVSLKNSEAGQYIVDREKNMVIPPIGLIPGLNGQIAQSIVEARNKRSFTSEEDLINRTKLSEAKLSEIKLKYSKFIDFDDLPEYDQMTLF